MDRGCAWKQDSEDGQSEWTESMDSLDGLLTRPDGP